MSFFDKAKSPGIAGLQFDEESEGESEAVTTSGESEEGVISPTTKIDPIWQGVALIPEPPALEAMRLRGLELTAELNRLTPLMESSEQKTSRAFAKGKHYREAIRAAKAN